MVPQRQRRTVRTRSGMEVEVDQGDGSGGGGKAPEPEPGPDDWTLQVYEALDGTRPFEAFLAGLDGYRREVLVIALRTVLARQGHNVCSSEWGKALRQGLYEFRVRRSLSVVCQAAGLEVPAGVRADQKVLLRVFFAVEGRRVVLLLGGYDKGADPSEKRQEREIATARRLLVEHKETERRRATGRS